MGDRLWLYIAVCLSLTPFLLLELLDLPAGPVALVDTSITVSSLLLVSSVSLLISKRVFVLVSTIAIAIVFVSFKSAKEYYDFYGVYPVYELVYMLDEFMIAYQHFIEPKVLLGITLLLLMLTVLIFRSRSLQASIAVKTTLPIVLVSLFSLLGSYITYDNIRFGVSDVSSHIAFSPQNESPLNTLIRSAPLFSDTEENQRLVNEEVILSTAAKQIETREIRTLPEWLQPKNYQQLLGLYEGYTTNINPAYPLYSRPSSTDDSNTALQHKPNVILIVLESVRTLEISQKPAISVTQNLDQIASQSVSVDDFYATNVTTVKSEVAMLCGVPEMTAQMPYSVKNGSFQGDCLPKILANNGYQTLWFHGNTDTFFNRSKFHPSLGFQTMFSKEDFLEEGYNENEDIGWGVNDFKLFDRALAQLESINEPFFAELLTVTNHHPFNWNYGLSFPEGLPESDDIYGNYLRGIYYTDQALGHFFRKFQKSKLHNNTILIITGDHGVPYYPERIASISQREHHYRFQVPLLIYGKNVPSLKITSQSSHLDIAPTIMSMVGVSHPNQFMGRPLLPLSTERSLTPIFTVSHHGYDFVYGDQGCFTKAEICREQYGQCFQSDDMYCSFKDNMKHLAEEQKALFEYLSLAQRVGYPSPE